MYLICNIVRSNFNNIPPDSLIQKDVSYSPSTNKQNVLTSKELYSAEACSDSCAEGWEETKDCKRFTWQIGNGKTCWLFKTDNLVLTYEFGSYSGIPRGRGTFKTSLVLWSQYLFQ